MKNVIEKVFFDIRKTAVEKSTAVSINVYG